MISPLKDMYVPSFLNFSRERVSEENYCFLSSLSKTADFREPKEAMYLLPEYKTLENKSVIKFCRCVEC
jgi:hypothetical protein